jgi:hypothetical protein
VIQNTLQERKLFKQTNKTTQEKRGEERRGEERRGEERRGEERRGEERRGEERRGECMSGKECGCDEKNSTRSPFHRTLAIF